MKRESKITGAPPRRRHTPGVDLALGRGASHGHPSTQTHLAFHRRCLSRADPRPDDRLARSRLFSRFLFFLPCHFPLFPYFHHPLALKKTRRKIKERQSRSTPSPPHHPVPTPKEVLKPGGKNRKNRGVRPRQRAGRRRTVPFRETSAAAPPSPAFQPQSPKASKPSAAIELNIASPTMNKATRTKRCEKSRPLGPRRRRAVRRAGVL